MKCKDETIALPSNENPELPIVPGEEESTALGRMVLQPALKAALTLRAYGDIESDDDEVGLVNALTEQMNATRDGDMRRAESMLTAQAHTLDAIYNNFARRAIRTEHMAQLDTYLKLALRAQSQCRATLETLSSVKNPSMGYVNQANISHGPQQVNNGPIPPEYVPQERKSQNPKNKLLENQDGERLDRRTKGTSGRTDPAMATMGKVNGTEDSGRQS